VLNSSWINCSLDNKINGDIVILVIILICKDFVVLITVLTKANYSLRVHYLHVLCYGILKALWNDLEIHCFILYLVVFVGCLNSEIEALFGKLHKCWLDWLLAFWAVRTFGLNLSLGLRF
jgi:hypothetical protein